MKKVQQVVMFCDIHNFMRLSLALGERMPEFVQAFYETVGDAVVANGGAIIKYIGDSVLSVFPEGTEKQAVRCAIRMRRGFGSLLTRYSVDEDATLEAAISSGEVTHGAFGHRSLRMDDVFGDSVAHAAILTRFRGIILTQKTHDSLGAEFRTEELPPVPLKWRNDSLRAWKVVESGPD